MNQTNLHTNNEGICIASEHGELYLDEGGDLDADLEIENVYFPNISKMHFQNVNQKCKRFYIFDSHSENEIWK